ncbi:transglutaminase family protein [Aquirufa aurantiipilula]|uniref:Transglutaminase family protein n=1 Tax=Aquirufa aurantiipilula TaxID=2696561 RepID=A0ABT6BMP1_9BACT|nr:transglutaminase family protein [Aquirufa aurantiipilula]MDF5691455.1 transglutaminase family protein [Aquirufa aurantiipilula]
MIAHIQHRLNYRYSELVTLDPHVLYLHPRKSSMLSVNSISLDIQPLPVQISKNLDPEGNIQNILYFKQPTDYLSIYMEAVVETTEFNPFDFVYFPFESQKLPLQYSPSYQRTLSPYLTQDAISPDINACAQQLAKAVLWDTSAFLSAVNEFIFQNFAYEIREEGAPHSPEITLQNRRGSCRDYAVLFAALCRAMGLATRFVSGYYIGIAPVDVPNQTHHLHAWVEVYLPGGGWRGYDPTQHEVVSGNHIPLAASCLPEEITPVYGTYRGIAISSLETEVKMQRI